MGQNPHDSLTVIYKSDKLIEVVNTQFPEIVKQTAPLLSVIVPDGIYIDPKQYGILREGEIKVYDRFYRLIKYFVYRDSVRILEEDYKNGKITSQCRTIPIDRTIVCTYYFDNGNPKIQDNSTQKKETTTKWYENGTVESICIYQGKKNKCDYWDDKGLYKNGIITEYKGYKDFVISEIEIDKNGKETKKIK